MQSEAFQDEGAGRWVWCYDRPQVRPAQAGQDQHSSSQMRQLGPLEKVDVRLPGGSCVASRPQSAVRTCISVASSGTAWHLAEERQGAGSTSALQVQDSYREFYEAQFGDDGLGDGEVPDTVDGYGCDGDDAEEELYYDDEGPEEGKIVEDGVSVNAW
ncbi:hypothetical protein NDU88_006243 [Pleurodeles waltl]|uniref:Uncharacterized protein n=1 Tax=Pleurodeles waltl TaxID=8319 RepID=A0AAV7WDV3_PLEWA|nr:hypothetical protein NDU88_006243 [Pleurodeles waltl]